MGHSPEYNAALAAVFLAGAAFIIACLQALLQYIGSSENRSKCSTPAIGCSHKCVSRWWSWSRFKIYYPVLDMSFSAISGEFLKASEQVWDDKKKFEWEETKIPQWIKESQYKAWQWQWEAIVDENPRWWQVANFMSILYKRRLPVLDGGDESGWIGVTIRDLRFVKWPSYLYWRLKHSTNRLRPRASWAQLFVALEIADTSNLVQKRMDADTIPALLDVPPQRIRLKDLGTLSFMLGFSSVTIDAISRTFEAKSPFATISTEEIQTVGKVLRFEGDMVALHTYISRCRPCNLTRAVRLASCQISFGKYVINGFAVPVVVLGEAIRNNLQSFIYNEHEAEAIQFDAGIPDLDVKARQVGYLIKEGTKMRDLVTKVACGKTVRKEKSEVIVEPVMAEPLETHKTHIGENNLEQKQWMDIIAEWQSVHGRVVPTMLILSTMCSIHSVTCGFPSRAVLGHILPWLRLRAKSIWHRNELYKHNNTHLVFIESADALKALWTNTFGFAETGSHFLMGSADSESGSSHGLYCWGTDYMKTSFDLCPVEVQNQIVQDGEAYAVLTMHTVSLLERFDVQSWLENFTEFQQQNISDVLPLNLLWTQIIVLDIAIQYTIRGGWGSPEENRELDEAHYDEGWLPEEGNVANAICQSWRLPGTEPTER